MAFCLTVVDVYDFFFIFWKLYFLLKPEFLAMSISHPLKHCQSLYNEPLFSPALLLPLSLVHGFVFYRGPAILSTHGAIPAVLRDKIASHCCCCYWVLHYYGMFPTYSIPLPCLNAFVYLFLNSEKVQWVSLKTEHGYIIVTKKKKKSTRLDSPLPFNKSFHLSFSFNIWFSLWDNSSRDCEKGLGTPACTGELRSMHPILQ